MKRFGKIMIIIGVIGILAGLIPVVFIYPGDDFSSIGELIMYSLFEAPERILWQLGVIILAIGSLIVKKQNKKGRIFY